MNSTGQPYGLQLAAPAGQDGLLLSIGLQLEKLFGTLDPSSSVVCCKGCVSIPTQAFHAVASVTVFCSKTSSSEANAHCAMTIAVIAAMVLMTCSAVPLQPAEELTGFEVEH